MRDWKASQHNSMLQRPIRPSPAMCKSYRCLLSFQRPAFYQVEQSFATNLTRPHLRPSPAGSSPNQGCAEMCAMRPLPPMLLPLERAWCRGRQQVQPPRTPTVLGRCPSLPRTSSAHALLAGFSDAKTALGGRSTSQLKRPSTSTFPDAQSLK